MWRALAACSLWLLASLSTADASAGTVAAGPVPWDGLATPLFTHLGIPRELPNIGMAITQDNAGMIWIATQSGLVRWDGYRPRLFQHDPQDVGSLPTDVTTGLVANEQGTLFVITGDGTVSRYDTSIEAFRRLPATPFGTDLYPAFISDGAGGLWLGNANGLAHLAAGSDLWLPVDLPDQAKILSLLHGRDGTLWVGTTHGLLRRASGTAAFSAVAPQSADVPVAGARITALYQTVDGEVWFGTGDGRVGTVGTVGPRRAAEMPPAGSAVSSLVEVRPGVLCAGARGGGLSFLDGANGRLLQHIGFDPLRPTGLASDIILGMFVDRSGGLWVANTRGTDYVTPGSDAFRTLLSSERDRAAMSGTDVTAILPLEDGKVWIGAQNGAADLFDPVTGRAASLARQPNVMDNSLPAAGVYDFAPSADGGIWVATGSGLFESKGGRVRRFDPVGDNRVQSLLREGDSLWIGLGDRGLARLDLRDRSLEFHLHDPADPTSISDNWVENIVLDPQRGLWVGTIHGLNLFDGRTFRRFTHNSADPDGLPGDYISTLLLDSRQRLWVGTEGSGVAILDSAPGSLGGLQANPVKFRHLSRADGLPCDNIDKLLEANDGRIWASSDCGVVMIDPNSLTIRAFGPADGMAVTAHWNSSGGRTADGTLLFGGLGGVTVVHPERRADWTYRPTVAVTAIRVGESNRPGAGALTLLPSDHSLQVEFAALDYSAPDKNRYAYRLVGFDDDWISTDAAHRLAAYTNLPPGEYSLLLRGSNRDGVWSDPPTTLLVTVLPAWYQTIWCMIAEILAAAGAICAVILYRTRMLHQRRVQLEREVAERTQELAVSAKTLQLSNAELERLAHHDPLTGLGNRRRFFQLTADLLVQARRHHRPCCVMMVDLDHFKRINDNFGHGGGDETLRATARCLVESLRQVDVVARFGGEELAVFLPETEMPEAFLVAERFRQSLESVKIQYEGAVIRVTASVGIACWVEPETGIEPALRRADAALYRVKNAGRNNVAIEPEITSIATTTGCTVA